MSIRTTARIDLSIVVVNWNSKDYLGACIESILANTSGIAYEIIVVDSASFDGCDRLLQQRFPQVIFIQCPTNIGFARANNLGAASARGSALLFLNPDTEVRGQAIEDLHHCLQQLDDAGVIGCRLLNSDGSLQTSCVQLIPTILNQVLDTEFLQRRFPNVGLWTTAAAFEKATAPVPVEAVSGACMLMKREVFDRVGQFSTDYFMYAEDIDLCYKTRAAGLANYYLRKAEIIHHGGGSTRYRRSQFANVMMREAVGRFLRKTRGSSYRAMYRVALSGAALFRLAVLVLVFPVVLVNYRSTRWVSVFSKWTAILRWGLGMEKSMR